MRNEFVTIERLFEVLSYNRKTGVFKWKIRPTNRIYPGTVAGCGHKNISGKKYWVIKIDRVLYKAHRLAWFYVHGEWPAEEIDHKDGNGVNNAISNLRCVDRVEQMRNSRLRADNKSGFMGVSFDVKYGKWRAQIRINGKTKHLGYFYDEKDAAKARRDADKKYKFHENHGSLRSL